MTTAIIPLGTASAVPTRMRHLSGLALVREGQALLFDCGEGTQFQLIQAGVKRTALAAIFITHLHGDHYFGLPGLLSTLAMLGRKVPLTLVAPRGVEAAVHGLPGLAEGNLPFPLHRVDLADDLTHAVVYETASYIVEARPLDHRIVTFGYRFQEKTRPGRLYPERARALGVTEYRDFGRLKAGEALTLAGGRVVRPDQVLGPPRPGQAFAYVTDTRPCAGGRALAQDAALLYHEATFGDDALDRAVETGHSTAREAAEVARDAGVDTLLVGHFSARYKDPTPLIEEARTVFQNTEAAEELKRYDLAG